MTRMARLTVALGTIAALSWACQPADSPTSPSTRVVPTDAHADRGGPSRSGGPDTVVVLKRNAALASDLTASADIGPAGGEIKIDAAGGKLSIPAGALTQTVHITMTAKAGWDVAYEFEPHGLVFATPAKVQQDLRITWSSRFPSFYENKLIGGYYEGALSDSFLDPWHFVVKVRETQPGTTEAHGTQFKFNINHFSGYLLSSGRSIDLDDR
jgi:hypothetical protein